MLLWYTPLVWLLSLKYHDVLLISVVVLRRKSHNLEEQSSEGTKRRSGYDQIMAKQTSHMNIIKIRRIGVIHRRFCLVHVRQQIIFIASKTAIILIQFVYSRTSMARTFFGP